MKYRFILASDREDHNSLYAPLGLNYNTYNSTGESRTADKHISAQTILCLLFHIPIKREVDCSILLPLDGLHKFAIYILSSFSLWLFYLTIYFFSFCHINSDTWMCLGITDTPILINTAMEYIFTHNIQNIKILRYWFARSLIRYLFKLSLNKR